MRWDVAAFCYWLGLLLLLSFDLTNLASAFLETRGCNRTVRNSVGWIRWTGRMGRCIVRIRAPLRDPQVIEMRIRRMQVGILRNARCEGAYVQFSDELEDLDESAGRYCGHVTGDATRLFLRRGPDLTVVLDSESRFAAENPVIFSAQFSILPAQLANERHHVHQPSSAASTLAAVSSAECPLECSQRNDRRACRLVSPGYPGVYPRGIRCRVALESSAGRFRIGGTPNDLYNLMNHTSQEACRSEFCEQEHVDDSSNNNNNNNNNNSNGTTAVKVSADQPQAPPKHQADQDEEDEIIIGQEEPPLETLKAGLKRQGRGRGQQHRTQPGADNAKLRKTNTGVRMRHGGGQHRRSGSGHHENDDEDDDDDDDDDDDVDEEDGRSINELKRNPVTDQLFWSKNRTQHHERSHLTHLDKRHERYLRRRRPHDGSQPRLGSSSCVGDYLALLESVNGRVLEIGKFCGEGRIPQILSRGRNVIVEFHAERDGTIMHDGFHLSLQESEAAPVATALASPVSARQQQQQLLSCDYEYRSGGDKPRESIKSPRSWYPPNTLCSYRFTGKANERVSVLMKIVRDEDGVEEDKKREGKAAEGGGEGPRKPSRRNDTLDYCPGNEIAVYNGTHTNGSFLMWSFCDATHSDINNIQVPIVSTGNTLLIQFFSATGSYNGQDFTYSITYKFVKRAANSTRRRQVADDDNETRLISLRPVNFSALNLTETDNCNCDFADRIGSFKSWFIVLVVLGVISFVGAILTIIALLVKCAKMRAAENKLLHTPRRSPFYKGSTD